ncbi:MAG: hypothetical protein KGN02_00915 [bacterium]|nr:hypothetical protein [bacterium]
MNPYAVKGLIAATRNALLLFVALSAVLCGSLYAWKSAIVPHRERAGVVCAPYVSTHRAFHASPLERAHADWVPVRRFDSWTGEMAYLCERSESRS